MTNALGQATAFAYDALGRVMTQRDPNGALTFIERDAMDRVTDTVDAIGEVSSLEYDANGNRTAIALPRGVIRYTYDDLDRMVTRKDALNQVESWTYDAMDRPKSHTDRRQLITSFDYDVLGRLSLTTYADGSTITPSYDAGDRVLSLVDTASGNLSWDYDDFDRVVEAASPQGTITYAYDLLDRRVSMGAPGQPLVEYRYDAADRLNRILSGMEIVQFDHDDAGRLKGVTLPNAVQGGYAYDAADRLTGLAWSKSDGASLGTIGYAYDGMGRIASQVGTLASQALTPMRAGSTFDDNNRMTQSGALTQVFDGTGNLISGGGRTYQWNSRNELESIKQGGTTIAFFGYDALGRRNIKTENGVTTQYLYDGLEAVQEHSSAGTTPILLGPGIDQRIAQGAGADRRYFVTDHLGSTRILTNSSGVAVGQYAYDAYGSSAATEYISYGYTGREADESGLYFYRARYYDPKQGRFISEDPIGLAGGLNMYAYVEGDPINATDPLGLAGNPLAGYRPAYGPIIIKTPTTPIHWVERIISSAIVGKLTLGSTSVNKYGQLTPKASTWIGRASVVYALMQPTEMDCAELDCDKNGIADFLERDANTCLAPGAGMMPKPFVQTPASRP